MGWSKAEKNPLDLQLAKLTKVGGPMQFFKRLKEDDLDELAQHDVRVWIGKVTPGTLEYKPAGMIIRERVTPGQSGHYAQRSLSLPHPQSTMQFPHQEPQPPQPSGETKI